MDMVKLMKILFGMFSLEIVVCLNVKMSWICNFVSNSYGIAIIFVLSLKMDVSFFMRKFFVTIDVSFERCLEVGNISHVVSWIICFGRVKIVDTKYFAVLNFIFVRGICLQTIGNCGIPKGRVCTILSGRRTESHLTKSKWVYSSRDNCIARHRQF